MTNTELVRQLKTASVQCDEMRRRDFGYLFKAAADKVDDLLNIISHLQTLTDMMKDTMSEWISVNERLPEPETEVLAAFDDGYVWAMWQKWSLTDEYEEGESPFDYYKDVGAGIHTVTHWMPLPKPPKEVDT